MLRNAEATDDTILEVEWNREEFIRRATIAQAELVDLSSSDTLYYGNYFGNVWNHLTRLGFKIEG